MDKKSTIDFPCDFPIKIVGTNTPAFIDEINRITCSHFPEFTQEKMTCKTSKESNYLSITVIVYAQNQETLDAFYQEVSKLPFIKMVL